MNGWQSLFLLCIGLTGHVILCTALVNRIHGLAIKRWVIDSLTLACGVALPAIPAFILWSAVSGEQRQLGLVSSVYLGLCALLAIWSAIDQWWFRRADRSSKLENHTSVLDLRASHGNALLAPGIVRMLGSLPGNEVLRIHVHEKQLEVSGLPVKLEGLRIAHLSDLHISGRLDLEYYAAVVRRVNAWRPELVAITGDIIENKSQIDPATKILGNLQASHGIYYVLGNHDKKTDHERIRRSLQSVGFTDVGGDARGITVRDEPLLIAGNELPWFPMRRNFGTNSTPFRLLLAHGPDQFAWAKQHGFQLMLAGHNHGGQVCFPLLGALVAPSLSGTRFAGGLFRHGNSLLHVSRGTGSLSPIRWNCPPEIALLTLRSQETADEVLAS